MEGGDPRTKEMSAWKWWGGSGNWIKGFCKGTCRSTCQGIGKTRHEWWESEKKIKKNIKNGTTVGGGGGGEVFDPKESLSGQWGKTGVTRSDAGWAGARTPPKESETNRTGKRPPEA